MIIIKYHFASWVLIISASSLFVALFLAAIVLIVVAWGSHFSPTDYDLLYVLLPLLAVSSIRSGKGRMRICIKCQEGQTRRTGRRSWDSSVETNWNDFCRHVSVLSFRYGHSESTQLKTGCNQIQIRVQR